MSDTNNSQEPPPKFTIIVNGRAKPWAVEVISFEEVVALAFKTPPYGENTLYSVAYKGGVGEHPNGMLHEGESVKVKDGMIFDVTATDKS